MLAAAASCLTPDLVMAVFKSIDAITSSGKVRHFLLVKDPLSPDFVKRADGGGFSISCQVGGKAVHQSASAYDDGYILSPDGSSASNAILAHNGYESDAVTRRGAPAA